MACNCNEGNRYNIGMGCCVPVLAPIENYYTKSQVDKLIEDINVSGVTEEEVDEKIASAKTEIENEIPTVPTNVSAFVNDVPYLTEHQSLDGYATEQWVEDKHYITGVDLSNYATLQDIPTVPTSNTAFTNDAGYLTQHQSLDGYATEEYVNSQISSQTADFVSGEELSSYTYDKSTIDSKIGQGGTFDPSLYYDKTATDALLADKLDASAYTPTDLSNYYTKSEVDASLSGKANSSDVITNIKANPSNGKAAISYTKNGTNTSVDIFETFGRGLEYDKATKQLSLNLVAGDGIQITNNNTISTTTKFQCLTEQEWASISGNPDTNTVYFIR